MSFRCPVCRMAILWEEAWCCRTYRGRTFYLCCGGCAELFAEQSARFASAADGDRERAPMPRVGALALDEFEAEVYAEWTARLGTSICSSRARVLERCVLSLMLGDGGRKHEVERLLAAELVQLRDPACNPEAALAALRRLPRAIEAAGPAAGLTPGLARSLRSLAEDLVVQVQAWTRLPRADLTIPAKGAQSWPR